MRFLHTCLLATILRKHLMHNTFGCKWRLHEHLLKAILLKKLTQIYHNYLKTPQFKRFFS